MNLYGVDFNVFQNIFTKYFYIEYISKHIRIRDIVSKNCIINIKLPFLISENYSDLLKSLYIQIFKHSDSFHLRYEQEDFELYNYVRTQLDEYIYSIILNRENQNLEFDNLIKDIALEHANNVYFGRIPSMNMKHSLNKIYKLNTHIVELNRELSYTNKFLVI
jgi:hypothetical protein